MCHKKFEQLFYLSVSKLSFTGLVIITHGENVLASTPCDIEELIGCTHGEADTRMYILLRTVDTDVVVISTTTALFYFTWMN